METFVTVFLAILAANVACVAGMFALMNSEKVQAWLLKYYIKYLERSVKTMEKEFEEGLL